MKRILITGANSYIGTSVEKWLLIEPNKYIVDTLDMENPSWREKDFSSYDVVFHVAGIAHIDVKEKNDELYYKVNRDLAIQTAKKAKESNVSQFIFMSSIIVYGDSGKIGENKVITQDTIPIPVNAYGKSKLQAEKGIKNLKNNKLKVVILRPPMIYGKGSKGNYPKLSKYAKKLPFFPDIENQRSMLYIDNLCEFVELMIENEEKGLFFPQNTEYVKTSNMVQLISTAHGKKLKLTKVFNLLLNILGKKSKLIDKTFGNLVYDKSISTYKENYIIRSFHESIVLTEK